MSALDFEQRQRLESEVLPAVIDDPEYAAATIIRLEAIIAERDARIAELEDAIFWALGYTDFSPPDAREYGNNPVPRYWWRPELRKRAKLEPKPLGDEDATDETPVHHTPRSE